MPSFSKNSLEKLSTCHSDLQKLFKKVVAKFDCTILCGHRDEKEQNLMFKSGRSQLIFPSSKHNSFISVAVDVAPYPIDWQDRERFHYFAGYVLGIAEKLGVDVVWGGDWNNDKEVQDNKFDDLPHFELVFPATTLQSHNN